MKLVDITGKKYNRLLVIERSGCHSRKVKWRCKCDCGNHVVVESYYLKTGHTKSCGCLRVERLSEFIKDKSKGIKQMPGYHTWRSMLARCNDEKSISYPYYGARGINVCTRWTESFLNFLEDMGEKPSPQHSLDRKGTNGDYEPDNCKWSTKTEQIRNRRISKDNTSGISGVSYNKKKRLWQATIYISGRRKHIGQFKDMHNAVQARKDAEQIYWEKESS